MSAAAGALTALVTQDAQAGTIDQQAAQQVGNALSDIVNSYEMGHTADAQHQLADLSQQITMLEQRGSITSAAAPALGAAVANLGTALANAPATTTQTPGAPPAGPQSRPVTAGSRQVTPSTGAARTTSSEVRTRPTDGSEQRGCGRAAPGGFRGSRSSSATTVAWAVGTELGG